MLRTTPYWAGQTLGSPGEEDLSNLRMVNRIAIRHWLEH